MAHRPTFVNLARRPILRLAGPDGLDLMQRISTNDVSRLKVGGAVHTILTTEKGKIKDVVSLLRSSDASLLLVGTLADRRELAGWIERFIIMEDIALEDVTEQFFHYQLLWTKSAPMITLGGETQAITLKDGSGAAGPGILLADPMAARRGPHLIGEKSLTRAAEAYLKAKKFATGDEASLWEFYAQFGIPIPGRELSGDVNPHEAGILGLVSFTKGCYIGQEVVARLETYKKVQKRLMSFALSDEPAVLPAPLTSGAEELGHLTTAVFAQDGKSWIGLGFVKTAFADAPLPLSFPARTGTGLAKVRTF